ncbi:MAG: ribulokinase [Lentisphaeraceae bacterium]|nr:ribulokinase [Lentisphaeraceae bacterium]
MKKYTIGLDYGTNSCRAVVMEIGSSKEIASSIFPYPSGELGILVNESDPHVARQHPQDYIDGMITNVKNVLKDTKDSVKGFESSQVKSLGFATTGSTVIPVDKNNQALALSEKHQSNYNAMAWLWKDHTSSKEAEQITALAAEIRPEYIQRCGGTYSSEWFWAKVLHLKNIDPATFDDSYSFVELCDFLPATLTGNSDPTTIARSICAAGHKALYDDSWGGLPDKDFLKQLDPSLADLRDRLYQKASPSDESAGTINAEWAATLGLAEGTQLAIGAFDAHMGAVGASIKEGSLIKIMGTSTCDLLISKQDKAIEGVCGTVKDSVVPGFIGIEAGQSAVGDLFLWFVNNIVPDSYGKDQNEKFKNLTIEADKLSAGQSGLLSLDWNNGNRCVLVDMNLSGMILGQTLHTKAHEIFRTLVEATAFGALKIIKRLDESDVKVEEIICCGGLAQKSAMMMQIYANITNRKIRIAGTEQTCAVGAAIFAAAVSENTSIEEIQPAMTVLSEKVFVPEANEVKTYEKLYTLYDQLHDSFGVKGNPVDLFNVMKDLHIIRQESQNA